MTANDPLVEFGQEIRRLREDLDMTLEDLSERANLTPNYIGTIENGKRDPSLSTISALANGLHTTVSKLLGATTILSPEAVEMARLFDGSTRGVQESVLRLLHALVKKKEEVPTASS